MKTKILLFGLLLFFSFLFCQNEWSDWGSWYKNECFPGVLSRVARKVTPDKENTTHFKIQFKNTYSRSIIINWKGFNNHNESVNYFNSFEAVGSPSGLLLGTNTESFNVYHFTINGRNATSAYIVLFATHFQGDELGKINGRYKFCDNGTVCMYCNYKNDPDCPNYDNGKTKSSSDSNVNNPNNNQQAERQRQQEEQNRIAQEINNRKRQYINVYNEGVDLGNNGKHSEAAVKYKEAIGLATNEQERKQAQDAYDRASKSGATVEIIAKSGEIYDAIEGVFSAIQKDKEAKRQKEAKEKETYLKNLTNNRDYHLDLISLDNSEMDLYNDYILDKFIEKGYKITLLQSPTLSSNKNIKSSVYRLQQSNEDFLQLHTDFTFADDQGLKRLCSVCSPNKSIKQITSITKEIFENSLKKIDVQDNEGYKCVDFSIDISPNFIKDNTQLN